MKHYLISIAVIFISSTAFADDATPHYDTKKIKDSKHAVTILKEARNVIFNTLSLPSLSSGEYEELHQLSYNMEAAIEKIGDESLYSDSLTTSLETVIEEIHKASEDYKKDTLKNASEEYFLLIDAL